MGSAEDRGVSKATSAGRKTQSHAGHDHKIVVEGLAKAFRTRTEKTVALADVNLVVSDGEFLCIVGPSGCGKTTLLRIMAGLAEATAGTMQIQQAQHDRPLTSMVFQEHSLFPWMNVFDNAAFGLEMRGLSKSERRERVMPYLDLVGLTRFQNFYPNQLSGGMKQRVSLVRAFVMEPEVLLMDEPFAALDAQNKLLLQDELERIWEIHRKTVVYITHGIDEAIVLGDRIAVMSSGPGRLLEIIEVNFPRPRNIFEVRATPEFAVMSDRIWKLLEAEVRKASGVRV